MSDIRIFTIGFTNKSAQKFFSTLRSANVKRVVDVRLNNTSQLAGFSKRDDLAYFLREMGGIDYIHVPELAPTQQLLDAYKKCKGSWAAYEQDFLSLMEARKIESSVARSLVEDGCLLCSEDKAHHCHRRLVAEYLARRWGNVRATHL